MMRQATAFLLVLLARATLSQPEPEEFPSPPTGRCETPEDCKFLCLRECHWVACTGELCTWDDGSQHDMDTEGKDYLRTGRCENNVCARTCETTSDCLDPEYCDRAQSSCLPKLQNGADCSEQRDCQSFNCVEGKCTSPVGKPCNATFDCYTLDYKYYCPRVGGQCVESDLADRQSCVDNGQCQSGCCKSGQCASCGDGKNKGKSCSSDSECNPGLACYESTMFDQGPECKPADGSEDSRCETAADCNPGLQCFQSSGEKRRLCHQSAGQWGAPCTQDGDCAISTGKCYDGQCKKNPSGCKLSEEDCTFGQTCCPGLTCSSVSPGSFASHCR